MKRAVFFLLALLAITGTFAQTNNTQTDSSLEKLEWILGKWLLTEAKPGISGTETWVKISRSEFAGTGITLREKDTVAMEKIKIITKDNVIFYVADVKENVEPVYFKFVKITNQEFVCENPLHDFPKKITYKIEGDNLKATISDGKRSISYLFKKE